VTDAFLSALSGSSLIDSPLRRFLGLEFVAPAEVRMPFSDALRREDAEDVLHGGVLAALVDLTGAWTVVESGASPGPTVDYRIDFLRPAVAVDHVARGRIGHRDERFVIVEVEVTDPAGRMIAVARLRYIAL
jgi:uncharacterized protein (TIGR00369 family)